MQYDYGSLISMGFRFYDAQRIGALPANYTIPWRSSALLQVCLLHTNLWMSREIQASPFQTLL